ncbi:efflux transporter outer membrane subunit [Pseudomonas granadensis]|uniref:efflux transporter outer membrane subunit n=1 Tax=Pseudomonas granadensis TaxID=1421430 RepID=UPI00300F204B
MHLLRPITLLVSVGLVAGCTVGPDYQRPAAPLPEHYQRQPAMAGSAASLVTGWESFNDPLLNALITQALAQNLDLAQAAARVTQARAGLGSANAALLPSASVNGQAARAYQSVETPLGQVLNSSPGYDRYGSSYEVNLEAGWELDVFGGLRREREAALAEYQASAAGLSATRLAIAAQTADTYVTLRGLQTRLDIARQQAKIQRELLEKVRLLYNKGLAASYQVRQIEGELAQVEASVPLLQTGVDAAINAMDVLLGTPPGTHRTELAQAGSIPAAPPSQALAAPADLLRLRPDLIVAERRLAASNARIGAAIAEYYPKFSLGALLGSATAVSAGNLFSSGVSQSAGVLGLRWRLFDFARINAQIDQAKDQQAEALAAYRQSVLRATEDVENALSAQVNRQAQASTLGAGEAALTEARQSSFSAYEKGSASLIDVLRADQTLLQTADARAQAQTESTRAAVALFKSLGGGWQPAEPSPVVAR